MASGRVSLSRNRGRHLSRCRAVFVASRSGRRRKRRALSASGSALCGCRGSRAYSICADKAAKLVLPKKPAALPLRPSRELEAAFLTAAAQSRLSPEQHQNRARAVKALSESPETETSGSGADSARTANELWGAPDARLMRLAKAAQPIARALGPDGARRMNMSENPAGFIPRPEVSAAKPPKTPSSKKTAGSFASSRPTGRRPMTMLPIQSTHSRNFE